ncbi:hypothetical protein Tco_1497660 [Tanacetum coccineum]
MLTTCYLLNKVHNKRNRITPYELWTKKKPNLNYLRVWGYREVVSLLNPKLKTLGGRGIECLFVGYDEHSKACRIPIGTEDTGGSLILEKVTKEVVVQQPEPELRKSKRNSILKNFGPEFQLYLNEGTRDEKEAINDEMDSIMGNSTWVLADLPPDCKPLADKCVYSKFDESSKGVIICLHVDDMLIFCTDQIHVDLTKKFLSSRFSMMDMGEAEVILVSTPMDTSEKLMPNNCQAVS